MNIEEAVKTIKVLIGLEEFNKLSYIENKAIETLLTAYEKEKEKNEKLQQIIIINEELYNRETKRLGNIISELLEE